MTEGKVWGDATIPFFFVGFLCFVRTYAESVSAPTVSSAFFDNVFGLRRADCISAHWEWWKED